jgi:PAS domain S-box-containing protein
MKPSNNVARRPLKRVRKAEHVDLFRLLVDRVVDYAIFLLTPDGHIASWNAGAERLKGYTAEEIIGQSFEQFYPPEARPAGRPARLLAIAEADGRVEDENWRVRKDGSRFWADVVITALRDDDGRLVGFAKVTRDLTERRLAEDDRARRVAAERAAERMDRLQVATAALSAASRPEHVAELLGDLGTRAVGAAAGAVALATPDGKSLRVAHAAGYPPDLLAVGDEFELEVEYRSPLTYAWRRHQPIFLGSREQEQAGSAELAALIAESPYSAWAAVPLVADQRVLGVLGLSFGQPHDYDADERGFLLALAEVGAQAVERARLYESEQLARGEAEAAVRAQDEFLSLASHELRTPVAAVKATAQLAERAIQRGHVEPERMARHLRTIGKAADRLGALVDDLLDVSRLRTGRLQLRPARLDLGALVEDIVGRYATTATGHRLSVRVLEQPAIVTADPLRLEQVLDNVLSNAVKYSPGGGEIQVGLRAERGGWTLTVTDQGIGLPAGQEASVFEAFARGSNATIRHIQGLGLGLAISRQLVEAHGGRIWATSPGEGRGATFGIWLPVGGAEAPLGGQSGA